MPLKDTQSDRETGEAPTAPVPSLREAVDGHVWALAPRHAAALQRSVDTGRVDPLLRAQGMEQHRETVTGSIAVIPLTGVLMHRGGYYCDLMGSSTDGFVRKLKAAVANPDIATILIDCDSPGGMVDGVPEAWQAVMDARKKKRIVAVVNTLMASAAYWICCAAETVVMTPSGEAGSIGVFILHMEVARMLEEAGIGVTMIRQPPGKADANPFEPLSDAARADLQGKVDETYRAFTAHVAKGRKRKQAEVQETFGQGRTLMAAAALDVGMVDRVGTFDAILSELLEESLTARAGRAGADVDGDRLAMAAADPDHAADAAPACLTCDGTGLKPERHMGDPQGQEPCPDCQPPADAGTSGEPSATGDASATAGDPAALAATAGADAAALDEAWLNSY